MNKHNIDKVPDLHSELDIQTEISSYPILASLGFDSVVEYNTSLKKYKIKNISDEALYNFNGSLG